MDECDISLMFTFIGLAAGAALGYAIDEIKTLSKYECTQTEVIKGVAVCTALELKRK